MQWLQDVDASGGDAALRLDVEEAELMTLLMPLYSLGSLESVLRHHKEKKVGVPVVPGLLLLCQTCRLMCLEHGSIEESIAMSIVHIITWGELIFKGFETVKRHLCKPVAASQAHCRLSGSFSSAR